MQKLNQKRWHASKKKHAAIKAPGTELPFLLTVLVSSTAQPEEARLFLNLRTKDQGGLTEKEDPLAKCSLLQHGHIQKSNHEQISQPPICCA